MKVFTKKLVVLSKILCLLSVALHSALGQEPDLYSEIDDVLRLNSTTFIPTVFHKNENTAYVVQFYNTFCGHCQMFAPIYKELATRVRNWTSVVKIAGIDCSKEENVITCSENKIPGYPTILIFPPNARPENSSDKPLDLRSQNIEWTVDDLEEAIVNYVSKLVENRNPVPRVAHALQPIQISDIKSLKRIYPESSTSADGESGSQDLMIVVESEKSYLGRKLILEYYRISHKLELRRVLTSNKDFLKSVLTDQELAKLETDQPLLIRLPSQPDQDEKALVLVRGEDSRILPTSKESERSDFIMNRFKAFLEQFYSIELKELDTPKIESYFKPKKVKTTPGNEIRDKKQSELNLNYLLQQGISQNRIFSIDILKGIVYMLTHEVKIKGDLSPEEVKTIRNMLTVLKKYLPLEKWDPEVHHLVVDLRTRIDDNRFTYEKNGISAQEMRDLLDLSGSDQVRMKYSKENWISCLESDRKHKGYTCSLWLLFHALTVGEYITAAPVQVHPTLVLYTMRDYITKFLGCTVCSSNFKKETSSLDASITSRNSSVLWLWKTHNLINRRLNNEKHEGKKALRDVIFPSTQKCPQCYLTKFEEIGQDGKDLEDIQWNMLNIPMYIIDLYRPDRVISPTELAILLNEARDKLDYKYINGESSMVVGSDVNSSADQGNSLGIFSTSDMSICLVLYLSCIVIVAVVCMALNPKWKRFKTK